MGFVDDNIVPQCQTVLHASKLEDDVRQPAKVPQKQSWRLSLIMTVVTFTLSPYSPYKRRAEEMAQ